jgi:hypothetical protein
LLLNRVMNESACAEPTTLWRLKHPDGSVARAVLVSHPLGCTLVWWINDKVEGTGEFVEAAPAIAAADGLRLQRKKGGWLEA